MTRPYEGAERVREVFARVKNGDLSVADLFTDDAAILYASGGRVEGRDAIRDFYEKAIVGIHPRPRVEAIVEAPPLYIALVDVPSDVTRYRALDLFEVDDTGIRRLEIYTRH